MSYDNRSFASILPLLLLAGAVAATGGCSATGPAEDDDLSLDESEAALHARPGRSVLGVRFRGLEPLGSDYVYEGWLMVGGKPISAGRFDLAQPTKSLYFTGPSAALAQATAYILTIEPNAGDDPAPSKVHVLAGDIQRGYGRASAALELSHPAALGTDFASAKGGYILETPSSAATTDYAQGVWFLDPSKGPAASLTLPALPEGWVYEGWVVTDDGPISTGRFKKVAGADSDGAGPTAGPKSGPPFPGQDFITPAVNLVGGKIVISVEPEPDDMPAPFAIKPLIDDRVANVGAGKVQSLRNMSATNNPRGIAIIF